MVARDRLVTVPVSVHPSSTVGLGKTKPGRIDVRGVRTPRDNLCRNGSDRLANMGELRRRREQPKKENMKPKRGMTPCNIRLLEAENFSQHAVFRAANTTGLRILSGSIYFTHSFRSDIRLPFCKKTVHCQNAFTSGDSRVS